MGKEKGGRRKEEVGRRKEEGEWWKEEEGGRRNILTLVPPQLLLTRPTGTSPVSESEVEMCRPKSQHTAEKVEKRVWPGLKSLSMVRLLATCHGSHTV